MPLNHHPPDSGQRTRITDPAIRAWMIAVCILAPISGVHATAQLVAADSPSGLAIALAVFIDVAVIGSVAGSLYSLVKGVRV